MLGTFHGACPQSVGRKKENVFLFGKKSFDFQYIFKDIDHFYIFWKLKTFINVSKNKL